MNQRLTQGLLLLVVVLLSADLLRQPARADSMNAGQSQDLFALVAPGNGNGQNVLYVLDPRAKRLAVYDDGRGRLTLRCVRDLEYELQLKAFPKRTKSAKLRQSPPVAYMRKLTLELNHTHKHKHKP